MTSWALQDAKSRFSEVVERAQHEGPQSVTKHGQEAVVVVASEKFRQLTRRQGRDDLVSFFRQSPLTDLDPRWLKRDRDTGRAVRL